MGMSLVLDLLKNPGKTLAPSVKPAPVLETPKSPAEEARLRLFESSKSQKSVTFSVQEAIAIRQYIEALEADPFSNPNAVLDTLDMQKLELQVDDTPAGEEDDDPFTNGKADPETRNTPQSVGTDRISVDTAVVAPDATPFHDEPIPSSVLASLQVLQSGGQEMPVNMSQPVQSQAPASGPTVNGMPIGQTRQAPPTGAIESRPQPRQAPVLAEGDVSIRQVMGNWRKAFKNTQAGND